MSFLNIMIRALSLSAVGPYRYVLADLVVIPILLELAVVVFLVDSVVVALCAGGLLASVRSLPLPRLVFFGVSFVGLAVKPSLPVRLADCWCENCGEFAVLQVTFQVIGLKDTR